MKKISAIVLMISSLLFQPMVLAETVIKFATDATYAPYEFIDATGELKGFDVDLAKAICNEIKAQCTFANQPFDSLIASLKIGKFDAIIAALGVTEARKNQVDFSDIYFQNTASIVAKQGTIASLSKEDMIGKVVGVQSGTLFENYLTDTYGEFIKINTYTTVENALLDLKSGRVDAVITETPQAKEWLKKNNPPADALSKGAQEFVMVGAPIHSEKYFGAGMAIAVKKGNTVLLTQLNQGLSNLKANGTLQQLVNKYFGE